MACNRGFRPTLYAPRVHVETVGSGPRVVLVHGSVGSGWSTFWAQRPLEKRFTLVVPDRPGTPPNPPVEYVDFEEQAPLVAELLEDGAHLVGHSYGGVISLYAAALRPGAVRSLTLIEPPAFGIALDDPAVAELAEELRALWAQADSMEPAVFLSEFSSRIIGRRFPPTIELPPDVEQGVRTLMVERLPSEADALGSPGLPLRGAGRRRLQVLVRQPAAPPLRRPLLGGAHRRAARAAGPRRRPRRQTQQGRLGRRQGARAADSADPPRRP